MLTMTPCSFDNFRRMIFTRSVVRLFMTAMLIGGIFAGAAKNASAVGPDETALAKSRQQAIEFLKNSQGDDGSWTVSTAPGITALVLYGMLQNGVPADDPTIEKGFKYLLSFSQPDGGVYFAESTHKNYESCISLMVFQSVNADGKYDKTIAGIEKFLRDLQWDEGEGVESADSRFGGAGYGGSRRPDMSNTQFLIEALKTAGASEDDPAIQKALIFVSRSQNLETENNTTPFASKINDGGFYYTPAAGGNSFAGKTDDGGLRSYGSMTYAGLKSMIYAGLKDDDPRVKAAREWIGKHYTVDENPGMGQQGLFYFYHTFAKTLAVLGEDQFVDADGKKHDWRKDLAEKLFSMQQENGSWLNSAERWSEADPNLATAYALMALAHCDGK